MTKNSVSFFFREEVKEGTQNEINAKKSKMRLYGFDYREARFLDPKILVEHFFRLGLGVDSAFIASHTFDVQWIIKSSVAESYLLLTFPSKAKRKEVKEKWRTMDKGYRPHGRPIVYTIM